jgi:tungstate transport system ATP-binding protein
VNQPILRVENLRKYYGDNLALEIPHLEFAAGGIYALIGPNGAGKTTLLRLLNLLENSSQGKIYFDGAEIDMSLPNALDARRQMTLVMQNPVLFRTSVYKNVAYGLSVRSRDKATKINAVLAALEMVGLVGFEDRKASQLSAGEAQRVALARALVLEPRVLFLDEPTANVDRRNVQVFESLIRKINAERGTTIVFTTHDLAQAYRLTDSIISLLDGKMISSSPENIFYGKIEKNAENGGIIIISHSVKIATADYKPECTGIYIDPRDITVSVDPIHSDGWSCLEGRITSVISEGDSVRLTVNVGVELVSFHLQEIPPNIFEQRVYATFKASDVHTF